MLDEQSGERTSGQLLTHHKRSGGAARIGTFDIRERTGEPCNFGGDSGGASRFFYCSKSSRREREAGLNGKGQPRQGKYGSVQDARPHTRDGYEYPRPTIRNPHPTVKPVAVMRWLCRLITPPGGTVLDPFCGSGSTGCAAVAEGFNFIGIEQQEEYVTIANARVNHWHRTAEPTLPMEVRCQP